MKNFIVSLLVLVCISICLSFQSTPPPFTPGVDDYPSWYLDMDADEWYEPWDFIYFWDAIKANSFSVWRDPVQDGVLDYKDLLGWTMLHHNNWPIFGPREEWEGCFGSYGWPIILTGFKWSEEWDDPPYDPNCQCYPPYEPDPQRFWCWNATMTCNYQREYGWSYWYLGPTNWPYWSQYSSGAKNYITQRLRYVSLGRMTDAVCTSDGEIHVIGFYHIQDMIRIPEAPPPDWRTEPVGYHYIQDRYGRSKRIQYFYRFIPVNIYHEKGLLLEQYSDDYHLPWQYCMSIPLDLQMLKDCWLSAYNFRHFALMANNYEPESKITILEIIENWLMPYGFVDFAVAANNWEGNID